MKKFFVTGVILLAIVAICFRIFSQKPNSSEIPKFGRGGSKGPVAVKTAEVRYGLIQQKKEFTGSIKASYTYIIASKVSGRLVKLSKRIGDKVKLNESVGYIEDTEYRNAVNEAEAQVRVGNASVTEAQAQKTNTDREAQRIRELVSKGISSQAELDAISTQLITHQSRLELAQAQVAQRQAALEQAQTRLLYTTLRASQQGYVSIRHTDDGSLLSTNSPILTIVGIDTVFVEIPVTERDYPLITKGQSARISVEALPGKTFTGAVRGASPSFQTSTRTAMVEIAVINDSLLLKPGMFTNINLTLSEKDSAQIIPFSSLITRNQIKAVFLVNDNIARLTPVSIGIEDNNFIEILQPHLNGTVVTLGHHLLIDSSKVITENQKNENQEMRGRGKKQGSQGEGKGVRK